MNRLLVIDHDAHSALLTCLMLKMQLSHVEIDAQSHHLDDLASDFEMFWINDNVEAALSVEKLVFRIHRRQPQALVVVWVDRQDDELATRLRLYGCDFIAQKGEAQDLQMVLGRLKEHSYRTALSAAV